MFLKFKGLGITAVAFAGLTATAAHAVQPPNLLTNGSFDSATTFVVGSHAGDDTLQQGDTTMPGWKVVGAGEVGWFSAANAYDIHASDGGYSIDLTGNTDAFQGQFGGLQQTVLHTVSGQSYHLTFDLGSDGQYGTPVKVTASAAGASKDFTSEATNGADFNANVWTAESWDFTATGSSLVLVLQGDQGSHYIGLDNVKLTGPTATGAVPEPAAWALMLVGFGGVGSLLRLRRRQRAAVGA